MGTRTVQAERVFTGTRQVVYTYLAILRNEAGSEIWNCDHRHRDQRVAQRCSESERRRWVRSGKGRA